VSKAIQPSIEILPWDVVELGGLVAGEARVVWVSPSREMLALVRLEDVSWPELMPYSYAASMIEEGAWSHSPGMPPIFPPLSQLTHAQFAKREANWNLLRHLFENHVPGIFAKKERSKLIRQIVEDSKQNGIPVSRRHVENLLRRALKSCMTKDSLRAWENCGKGQRRPVEELAKLGRPPQEGHPPGINVDSETKRLFALSLRRFWAENKNLDLRGAYDACMRTFFLDVVGDLFAGGGHVTKERYRELGLPTYEQFRYWAPKVVDLGVLGRRKLKPRIYDQETKANLGTSLNMTWGPGGQFQIDATVLDIYIRSRANGRVLIGRPVLYIVIDTFSRMICGIYLGLESPSWTAAMMALANCCENKVEFCRRYGVQIAEEEWPVQVVPAVILGDKGEMERQFADNMIDLSNVMVANAAPYRGDWKGIVESCFRILPAIFKPYVPGYIDVDFKVRGVRDYRADAVFDLDDLIKLFIHLVLHHNNDVEVSKYPRHQMMDEDDVPSVPRDLWNWGISKLSGIPRQPNQERFRFGLMPQATAKVTDAGILFEGRFYTCPTAEKRGWFSKAKKSGRFELTISYDKRRTKEIMVHVPGRRGFEVARRINKGVAEDRDLTAWEEEGRRRQNAARQANRRDKETIARANMDGKMAIIAKAAAAKSAAASAKPVTQQIANIRENRAEQLAADRAAEAESFASGITGKTAIEANEVERGGNVVPFPTTFSIPDFASDMDVDSPDGE
jgi:hypothetical protein